MKVKKKKAKAGGCRGYVVQPRGSTLNPEAV
jgi:hypothetical protein